MLFSWLTSATPTPPPAAEGTAPKPLTDLLPHYDSAPTTNGRAPPPPSARVVPVKQIQRQRAPVGLLDLWHYGSFVAHKATEIATDVLHHTFYGPRRKSWGLEMTLISAFMRNIGQKSHLAEINTLRALLQLGGMVPLPSDALVTPVTFRVRKRNLRGILADFDAAEDGTRELSGEWVVGKKLWHRLNTEWKAQQKADGTNGKAKGHKHRVMLFIHGGAYYVFSAATHRLITIPLSKAIDARIFSLDYRLAPETKFPGPLHDAVSAYFRLIDDLHIPPENVILAGDSAGGALTLALLMYLRDNDYPLPAGAMLFSPWVDLTMSCDSWDSNAAFDVVPRPIPGDHLDPIMCYLGEGLEQYLTHPYASPLFGDFTRLPPMLIQAGEAECLRDEITLLAHKATRAGVQVQHELFEDAVHVFQMFPFLDLTTEAFKSCRNFVRHVLPLHAKQSPKVLDGPVEAELEHETGNAQSMVVRGDGQEEEAAVPDHSPGTSGTVSRQATDDDSDSSGRQDDNSSWTYAPGQSQVHVEIVSDSSSDDDKQDDGPRLEHRSSNSMSFPAQPTTAPMLRRTLSSMSRVYPVQPSPSDHSARRQRLSLHYPSSGSRKSVTDSQVFIPLDGPVPPQLSRTPSYSGSPTSTGGAKSPDRRKRSPTISHSSRDAPPPAVRQARERTQSHPDITALCVDWRARGPANVTTTYHS